MRKFDSERSYCPQSAGIPLSSNVNDNLELSRASVPLRNLSARNFDANPLSKRMSLATSVGLCEGSATSSPRGWPSITLCASEYASFAIDLGTSVRICFSYRKKKNPNRIIVLPNHFLIIFPSVSIVNMTENARRSWPGRRLHSCSLKAGGSMGTARWTR